VPKIKFVGQGTQKLKPEQDRQTDATENIATPHSQVVLITAITDDQIAKTQQADSRLHILP